MNVRMLLRLSPPTYASYQGHGRHPPPQESVPLPVWTSPSHEWTSTGLWYSGDTSLRLVPFLIPISWTWKHG